MAVLVDRGTPVVSLRQLCPSLSPNAAGTGWNYIVAGFTDVPNPIEWIVLKNLTTTPVEATFGTTPHGYPNQNFSIVSLNQLRAQNGRIFFPLFGNAFAVYRPDTEDILEFGPFIESPPIDPNASTIPFSGSFDTSGMLYFATQESHDRPSCLVSVNPTTLAITVIGYFGTGSTNYTSYGYYIAPDTGTTTKGVWAVYGQTTWQLWFVTLAGVATMHYEVPSTGHIAFQNIPNKGWVAQIHTDLGQPDDVFTQWWCLADPTNPNGQLYAYSVGVDPPAGLARNVTPLENPLVNPPDLDTSGGLGVVGWRPNGSSNPYTYVDYNVQYAAPVPIEMMVTAPDGIMIGVEQYQGFVRYDGTTHVGEWFGAQSGATIAQPLALYVPSQERIFLVGYPDGTFLDYDPESPWETFPSQVNPALGPFYGPSGNQKAGIKYAGQPATPSGFGALGSLVWDAAAGSSGRLYCAGTRDRTGTGAGIGYWDKSINDTAGTFAAPLTTVQPQGLVLAGPGRIAMSTNTLSGTPTAPLYVFDESLTIVATQFPVAGIADLGPIFPTSTPYIICGAYIDGGNNLALYRWNVQTGTLVQTTTTSFSGVIDCSTLRIADGSVWIAVGNSVVHVNPDTLSATLGQDITSIAPISTMAFFQSDLYMSSSAELWSATVDVPSDIVIDLVEAGANWIRFLVHGSTPGIGEITTDDLLDELPAGPLRQIALAFQNGYGKLDPGVKSQTQARALWLSDNKATIVGVVPVTAIAALSSRLGLPASVDADVDGGGKPRIVVTPPASGSYEFYLDLKIPGGIGR